MLRGPCGPNHPNYLCMHRDNNGEPATCSKKFPKPFENETVVNTDGYPSREGPTIQLQRNGQSVTFDNRWVVPYNPYLLRKYGSHINVEICASVKAVKYIHKYIYKGNDLATGQAKAQLPSEDGPGK